MIYGHATSISLESAFWDELKKIAKRKERSLNQLISEIDAQRSEVLEQEYEKVNLSSALRLYILQDLKARLLQPAGEISCK